MQTFLPHKSYAACASFLDKARLGKQRVEVLQIMKCLVGESDGWKNHPCVRMWRGYEYSLVHYGVCMCNQWKSLGYKDTCKDKIVALRDKCRSISARHRVSPLWLNDDLIRSHQSNLVRKFPEHYRRFFPDVPNDLPYVWPVENVAQVSEDIYHWNNAEIRKDYSFNLGYARRIREAIRPVLLSAVSTSVKSNATHQVEAAVRRPVCH